MALDTKPNLNSDKFEQFSGDTLNISGTTRIFGNIEYGGSAPVNFYAKSLIYRDFLLSGSTSLFRRDLNATTPNAYAFHTNTLLKGQGQVTLTNGSSAVVGIGTNFTDSTVPTGLNFWFSFWVKDSANNWYRIDLATITNNTGATISRSHSRTLIRQGSFNISGNASVPTVPSTFQGTTGTYDYYLGFMNWSDGYFSIAMGNSAYADNYSIAIGGGATAIGTSSISLNQQSFSSGQNALAIGAQTRAIGTGAVAIGYRAEATANFGVAIGTASLASGNGSFAGGLGFDDAGSANDRFIVAAGQGSINLSENNASQTVGHGARAQSSAIIGGLNHDIPSNSTRSAIIGGNTIKATSATTDTVFMPKVRIGLGTGGELTINNANTNIIVRNATTGELEIRSALSLTGSSVVTANNGLTKSGTNVRLGGTLTGNTTIGLTSNNLILTATTGTLRYGGNYSSNYVARSIPDVGYVTGITSTLISTANNGLTKVGTNVRLGGTLTGNTTINGSGFTLNLGTISSTLNTLSATTNNNQYYRSNVVSADPIESAIQFINNTGNDSAGRAVASFEKRWTGGGSPDSNNSGNISYILPNTSLTRREAIIFRWSMLPTAGSEISTLRYFGFYTGSTKDMILIDFRTSIGMDAQTIGSGDIAVGLEAKTWNASQISIGYRAGKTSGAVIGRSNAISIGVNANQGTRPIGSNSIAIGTSANAVSGDTISMGRNAGNTSGIGAVGAISIGVNANQGTSNIGENSIAIGSSTKAVGDGSIAIGSNVQLTGSGGNIGIGINAFAAGGSGIAIGVSAQANSGAESTAIGGSSRANTTSSTAIGFQAGNSIGTIGTRHSSFGAYANQGTHNIGTDSIGIGGFSKSIGLQSLAIGYFARSGNYRVVSIGDSAGNTTGTTNEYAINIGYRAGIGTTGNPTIGLNSISIGSQTSSSASGSIAIGNNITNNTPESIQFGWGADDDLKFIKGIIQTTNNTQQTILQYTLASGATYSVKATVKARETSGADRALYDIKALAYREGGGAVLEGGAAYEIDVVESTGAASWDGTIDVSGNNIRIRVTGAASTTINWHVIMEIQRVS